MDATLNFNIDGLTDAAAPDNNSSALQTAPNYPASLGDPELDNNPLKGFGEVTSSVASSLPQDYVKKGPVLDYELVNKYKGTSAYSPYMTPYADNETIAANNWGIWDAVATGLSGLTDNAVNAGKEYAYGWARAGRALINFDSDYLTPSNFETQVLGAEQALVGQANPIYYDPGTKDDIFTRGFAAEFLQNTGFTFGTMAGFLTETALLGGAGKLFTKLPSLFKAGAAAKSIKIAEQGNAASKLAANQSLDDAIKNMYGTGVFTGKTIMDNALNVASRLPIIGAVADAGKIARAARTLEGAGTISLTGTELARIGGGGLKRAFSEWNFAASEAAIEAGGTYGEVYDELYDKYQRDNDGRLPEGEALQEIRDMAMDASGTGYATNFAVLAIMNKIQFGNLFRNFGTDSKFLSLLRNDADRVIAVHGLTQGGKQLTKFLPKGYLGAIGHRSEIVNQFGKATFYRTVGRDMLRGMGRIELSEGLQENIQEGTNEFLKSYYSDLYDDDAASWGSSFKEAFDSQLTKRGFKTFLQGALTGFAIRPVTGAASAARNAYLEKQAAKANPEHVGALQQTLNRLNAAMADPDKLLRENHRIIKTQVMLNEGMTKGAALNDKYQFLNNKDSAIIQLALDAKRTGTFDAFKTMLDNYGQSLDNKEFKEATGIDLKAEGFSSAAEYTAGLTQKLDKYSNIHDKYSKMFGDYLSYEGVFQDDYSKQRFKFAQAAIQDAIHIAAFNEAKAESSAKRAADIAQGVANIRAVGQSASANFNNVTNYELAAQQILIIDNEIKTLKESGPLTAQVKKQISYKEKEKKALQQWNEIAYSEEVIATPEGEMSRFVPLNQRAMTPDQRKKMSKILSDYYYIKNLQSEIYTPFWTSDIEEVLDNINDFQRLDRDTKDYIEAVNLLTDPKNLIRAAHSYEDARVAAYARLAHDTYQKLAEESEIFANYIKDNPKELENLKKIATSPFGTYDSIASVIASVTKINQLVEQDEEQAKNAVPAQPATPTVISPLSLAVNIKSYSIEDASNFISSHYNYIETEDGEVEGIKRYYTDEQGQEVVTHEIKLDLIQKAFPDVDVNTVMESDLLDQFLREFEQALYYQQNPTVDKTNQQAADRKDSVIKQAKKLHNLVGQRVMYLAKPGTLEKDDTNYYVRYDDGEVTILGPIEEQTETAFRWRKIRNATEYKLEEINPSATLSTDNFPYLHVLPDNLTEQERKLIGESLEAIVARIQGEAVNVQYSKTETSETIDIGGNLYAIVRDNSGALMSMTHEFDEGKIVFTAQDAANEPNGLASKYIAIANMAYIHNMDMSENQIDAAIEVAQRGRNNEERVITSTKQRSITPRKGKQNIEQTERAIELIDRILESVPEELVEPFDAMMSMNADRIREVSQQDRLKVLDWVQGAIKKLNNLDKDNPDVISYITLLNDLISGPMAKKDGRTNKEKQPRKAAKQENQTAEPDPSVKSQPGEPSAPSSYKHEQGTVSKAAAHVEKSYSKKDKELAVKIEELLPESADKLYTPQEINDAANASAFNKRSYRSNVSKKKDIDTTDDPYNNPPFSCI
jgi:hypothetical protein